MYIHSRPPTHSRQLDDTYAMDSSEVTLDIRPTATRARGALPLRKGTFVIVGAGQAGVQAAITLRDRGFEGRIVLLGNEQQPPYMRPPLSKKFLTGELSQDRLYLRPGPFYESNGIELRTGIAVERIDRAARMVRLGNGERQAYDKLLLATGTRARELPVAGAKHDDVRYLRSFDDAQALRPRLVDGNRLVVIGGGYVGLEVAATAAQAGLQVTVLEAGPSSRACIARRATSCRSTSEFQAWRRSRRCWAMPRLAVSAHR